MTTLDPGREFTDLAQDVEADTIEQVDIVFRAQRRLTITYAVVFFGVTLLIPLLSITAPWWYAKPVWGGMSLNFVTVALGLHVVYWLLGLLYTIQANRLEDKILGEQGHRRAKGC